MRPYIFLFIALLFSSLELYAQVDQSVEVTREYIPELEQATKPSLRAEIADTTTIRPDVDYNIMPLSISTSVATKPIEPTQVAYWQFSSPDNITIKAGLGYPLASLFDGYYSRYNADSGYLLAYVNHRGDYLDQPTPFGGESLANMLNNSVGAAGGVHFGVRKLHTAFEYNNDIYHRKAAVIDSKSDSRINYQSIDFDLCFGDSFVDLSRWNFMVDFGAEYFWNRVANSNRTFGGGVDIARDFGEIGSVAFNAGYQHLTANEAGDSRSTGLFELEFLYGYNYSNWGIEAGVIYRGIPNQYIDADAQGVNSTLLTPLAGVNYSFERARLYASFGGDMDMGNYAWLAEVNPYILPTGLSSIRSTRYHNFQMGVEGSLMERNQLSYSLYGEWLRADDDMLWLLSVDPVTGFNFSSVEYINQTTMSLNFEVEYRVVPQLLISLDSHLYHFDKSVNSDGYDYGRANFEGGLSVTYSHSKFNLGARSNVVTARNASYIYDYMLQSVELPATVDLGCFFDFTVGRDVTVFFEANNLLNQTIYEIYGYRELGINFMAGVKFTL